MDNNQQQQQRRSPRRMFGNLIVGSGQITQEEAEARFSESAAELLEKSDANVGMNEIINKGGPSEGGKEAKINQNKYRLFVGNQLQDLGPQPQQLGPRIFYKMGPSSGPVRRGRCVVLNYQEYTNKKKNRAGSEHDVERIKHLFGGELNFDV
jgi:hypothetical protein